MTWGWADTQLGAQQIVAQNSADVGFLKIWWPGLLASQKINSYKLLTTGVASEKKEHTILSRGLFLNIKVQQKILAVGQPLPFFVGETTS